MKMGAMQPRKYAISSTLHFSLTRIWWLWQLSRADCRAAAVPAAGAAGPARVLCWLSWLYGHQQRQWPDPQVLPRHLGLGSGPVMAMARGHVPSVWPRQPAAGRKSFHTHWSHVNVVSVHHVHQIHRKGRKKRDKH